MRHEPRHAFQAAFATKTAHPTIPRDLAFLYDVIADKALLREAAHEAERLGIPASSVLIAAGGVSAALYYRSLAVHLGLSFVDGSCRLSADCDPARVIADGFARLSDPRGEWLMAPRGPAIDLLLKAKARDRELPRIAITTPAHLSALVRRTASATIAHRASFALLEHDPDLSARTAIEAISRWTIFGIAASLVAIACLAPNLTMTVVGLLFFAAMSFRLIICANAFRAPPPPREPLNEADLPVYSVLVPLYDEAGMIPSLIQNLDRLDYPDGKLQVLILVEADDRATQDALRLARLTPRYEIIVVPEGHPRTKPRALNVGMAFLRGEIVTIFDAEDRPDTGQLRQAAIAFHYGAPNLACLQARLAVDTLRAGYLARLFAIEYASLFEIYNVGLAGLGLPMALGGTSNHFKVDALRRAGGWDAWNVAEDADLGFRLARFGYRIGVIESTTREQALEDLAGWFKQRRRWTKGWMQTILVLAHRPRRTSRDFGPRYTGAMILIAITLLLGPLVSPLFLMVMMWNFARHGGFDARDAGSLATSTLEVSVLLMGVLAPLWCGYVGLKRGNIAGCRVTLPLIIPYQAMIAAAAWAGVWDLFRTPYHWHKTAHVAKAPLHGQDPNEDNSGSNDPKKSADQGAFQSPGRFRASAFAGLTSRVFCVTRRLTGGFVRDNTRCAG